jgi:toxin-antitoxin system PIN domain toxin
MKHLSDANPWLAMTVEIHPHHAAARHWMDELPDGDQALFNRATQTSFLRLLTQPIAPGYRPVTQSRAWKLYEKLLEDDRVLWVPEPEGIDTLWQQLSENSRPSPKLWMDAYLAAFAISEGCRMVTFDRGFKQFGPQGLDLLLLSGTTASLS